MASTRHLTQNDTAPSAAATLTDKTTGLPVDLQAASSVNYELVDSSGTVKVSAAGSIDQVGDGSDGTKGDVSYDWAVGDTDTAGTFKERWQVTYNDGTIRTFPTPGENTVIIQQEFA